MSNKQNDIFNEHQQEIKEEKKSKRKKRTKKQLKFEGGYLVDWCKSCNVK